VRLFLKRSSLMIVNDLARRASHRTYVLSTGSISQTRQSRYGTLQSGKGLGLASGSSSISMTSGSGKPVGGLASNPEVRC
jgi:hypothetical protein